ncbi:MAG: hypothetical protein KGQ41_03240 [Alphaproteobacteria bacterium]|nr:hypothetical protein [Alphaproteobacteria bacterium]
MTDMTPTPAQAAPTEGRYSVADDGQIFFQEQPTNPLPGVPVGRLQKGDALLAPKAVADAHPKVQEWLDIHTRTVLEPLFKLKQVEGEGALTGAAAGIGERLYDHLGVMHRSELEDLIAGLDADMRKALRSKGVRLGPVLVFLPALVKPAAIRMRAILWALWNDKALPIAKPADGRVSEVVDTAAIDRDFYRMIGYPVFGPRCIRIDMLDRVVTDIYDTAEQGVFEAKHKYAEWFGSSLDDLYAVLESMGHRRLKDEAKPAAEAAAPAAEAVTEAPALASEGVTTEGAKEAAEAVEAAAPVTPKAPAPLVKFMLKRGKMSDRPQPRNQHGGKPRYTKPDAKPEGADSKPERGEKKFTPKKSYDPNRPNKKHDREEGDERPRKPKFDRNKDRDQDRAPKVYTFEGKKTGDDDANNPFAILKNLKKQ